MLARSNRGTRRGVGFFHAGTTIPMLSSQSQSGQAPSQTSGRASHSSSLACSAMACGSWSSVFRIGLLLMADIVTIYRGAGNIGVATGSYPVTGLGSTPGSAIRTD